MIKAFLFDYDGVITEGVKDGSTAKRLANNLNVTIEEALEWVSEIWNEYSTGSITDDMLWKKIEKLYGKEISEKHKNIWFEWEELTPLPKMLVLVEAVKSKGYMVGLLSNVMPVTAELIREHGGYEGFDFQVLSCEAGARKPDKKIYELAMSNLKDLKPEEVLFLDDRERCIVGANEFGLQTLLVTNHDEAIKKVRELIGTI